MGVGNQTYGQELRGEGKGAFLSAASALPLSVHPLFTGKLKPPAPMTCRLTNLKAAHKAGALLLTGQLQGGPPAVGLVAHNHPVGLATDYDAVGWTCPVDGDGKFRLVIEELKPGNYDLRLTAYGESGDKRPFQLHYCVDQERRPLLPPLHRGGLLKGHPRELTVVQDPSEVTEHPLGEVDTVAHPFSRTHWVA
jgi:hypothetical protein